MKANPTKVKFIIFLAILAVVCLVILNVALLVSIHKKNVQLYEQQSTIAQQEQLLDYYTQQQNQN